jgi:hypothetical protein
LFGKLENGGEVRAYMQGDEVRFDIKARDQTGEGPSSSNPKGRETVSSGIRHD